MTLPYNRYRIRLGSFGIEFWMERPAVGGGWYTRELLVAPYPWNRKRT